MEEIGFWWNRLWLWTRKFPFKIQVLWSIARMPSMVFSRPTRASRPLKPPPSEAPTCRPSAKLLEPEFWVSAAKTELLDKARSRNAPAMVRFIASLLIGDLMDVNLRRRVKSRWTDRLSDPIPKVGERFPGGLPCPLRGTTAFADTRGGWEIGRAHV